MLAYYAERFPTVEINYTFYRMPTEKLLAGWADGTPDGFSFTLKAPRRITHDAKLQRCEDLAQAFCETAATLGPKLGVLLFQLPPNFKKDVAVLSQFSRAAPRGHARRIRVPPSFVVRGRRVRRAARRATSRSALPTARSSRRLSKRRPTMRTCACATRDISRPTSRNGRPQSAPIPASRRVRLFQARRAGPRSRFREAFHRGLYRWGPALAGLTVHRRRANSTIRSSAQ